MRGRSRRALALALIMTMLAMPIAAQGAEPAASTTPVLTNTLGRGEPMVGTDISSLGGQQYHQNNQRNMWWNEYQQRWDGILPTASPPASRSSAWWLWYGLEGTPTSIQELESAPARTPDTYWDADEQLLYVFFSRGNSGTSKFRRYAYDPAADTYVEDSVSGGVNAPTRLRGGKRVTIIKSPNGHLWAGVNSRETQEILISRSTDGGNTWPEPVVIKTTALDGEGHWVTFTDNGSTRVAFAATEDGAAPDARVHFLHLDENEPEWRDPARWTDETSLLPGWEGDERADDELSAVAFENRVFIAIETEPLGDARSAARPQLIVYERTAEGGWLKHVILRYQKSRDDAKRPVITVDASARLLIVSGGTTQRTHADLWYAPIDALEDHDERWSTLRVFEVDDPVNDNIYTTRMPLPRFPVAAESSLPILIDDREVLRMRRQVVRSSGGDHPGDPGEPNRPPVVHSVSIDQSAPRTDDTLTLSVSASDPDGDPLTYRYQWSKNGRDLPGATAATLDLAAPGNGDKGDRIAVRVTASDGQDTSDPVASDEVVIVNSPPRFDQELEDRTDREGATVSFSASATDADGDPLTYTASQLPAGVSIHPSTGLVSGTITTGADGRYDVTVEVTDGDEPVVTSFRWTVTASDPAPSAPTGLTATATSTEVLLDWIGSTGAAGYHVYRAGASAGPYARLTTTPSAESAYVDPSAPPGTSYYRVTAVDANGAESSPAETVVTDRIVLRSVSEATDRGATTLALPRPAGLAPDDVLVATIAVNGTGSITPPAGWTLVEERTNGSEMRHATFYRVATAVEPGSYGFTFSVGSSVSGVGLAYQGVDTSTPIDDSSGQANPSAPTITAPQVTTSGPNRLLVGTFSVVSNARNGLEPPPEMIERADALQGQGRDKIVVEVADEILPSDGGSGARTATTDRPGNSVGHLVALRPSGT